MKAFKHFPMYLDKYPAPKSQFSVFVSGSKLWEVPTAPFTPPSSQSARLMWEPQCHSQLSFLRHRARVTAAIPPNLDGTWVSTRCEVRPGPEFLMRSYTFLSSPTRLFKALQHYYADSGCQVPTYSLVIRGKLRLRQASWITRGATEAEHHLHKVGIVVHSMGAARHLSTDLPSSCLGLPVRYLVPHQLYELFNAKTDRDCLAALGFSMMELDLLRVETQHHPDGGQVQELFLGDVHTDWSQRTHYRPTEYQEPLQNSMYHIHPCPVCARVYRATELRPPSLPPSPVLPLVLDGRWVSQRCEARPAVLFLTREFVFSEEQHVWEGMYRHYSDPVCLQPTFTIHASGHYVQSGPSSRLRGATELVFKVMRASVTVHNRPTARLLNSSREQSCGQSGGWEVGVEQDVTWTGGCSMLGIRLPHKEYELFKMEQDHKQRPLLFIGERPTDGSSPDRPQKRPTSYQAPLVQCSLETPRLSQHSAPSAHPASGSAGSLHPVCALLLLSVLNIIC
ncbi:protein APCDD1-like [Chanos chanos]|uniref:Protein APCDD1-like n=1 Tax=Chanos chanos TaxID=29144 RepID=A0A6J2VTD6_CHACN|nr:protein APCDD1-like [Chanos chanos]